MSGTRNLKDEISKARDEYNLGPSDSQITQMVKEINKRMAIIQQRRGVSIELTDSTIPGECYGMEVKVSQSYTTIF